MVEPIFEYQFRVILIGDSTVGKSSLLKFFTEGKYEETCDPTVGVDFFARLIEVKPGVRVKLQLWDTAGQERFRSITRSYYRNSAAVLLVYDITKRRTFDHLEEWLEESRIHLMPHQAVYAVVGHKSDAVGKRVVSAKEGRHFAESRGFKFLETSAVTGQNVEESFVSISRDVYERVKRGSIKIEEGWEGVKPGYAAMSDSECSGVRLGPGGLCVGDAPAGVGGCC